MNETRDCGGTLASSSANGLLPDPLSILLVGEGNLSFAYALVRRLSHSSAIRRSTVKVSAAAAEAFAPVAAEVVATTFDPEGSLNAKYPEAVGFRAYFEEKRRIAVRYCGSVNATALSSSLHAQERLDERPFHVVIFNNPHVGFEDLYRQRSLLSHFFASVAELGRRGPALSHPQQVVVALCDEQALRWDLLGCAARSGYVCVAAMPLRPTDYPEYTNRRHQSDSAFPFSQMVQFWFVRPTPSLDGPLSALHDELSTWQLHREQGMAPSNFTCASWLQIADALLPRLGGTERASAGTSTCAETEGKRALQRETGLASSASAGDSVFPFPLLDPAIAQSVLRQLAGDSTAEPCTAEGVFFTPYLPSCAWAVLYRRQRQLNDEKGESSHRGNTQPLQDSAVPPHLDTALLGRPLTTKEVKKLERFLAGYGAAMRAKAAQQKQSGAAQGVEWWCTECTPPRQFDLEGDLKQHQVSKHSGAAQLPPTLYARVHEQIDRAPPCDPAAALVADVATMSLTDADDGAFCAICGLRYTTQAAYEEHLEYLSPLPGDKEEALVCERCVPPRVFTDRRALEQHRASKHS